MCSGCLAKDCGSCKFCLDMPKFGGPGKKKKRCVERVCRNKFSATQKTTKALTDMTNISNGKLQAHWFNRSTISIIILSFLMLQIQECLHVAILSQLTLQLPATVLKKLFKYVCKSIPLRIFNMVLRGGGTGSDRPNIPTCYGQCDHHNINFFAGHFHV